MKNNFDSTIKRECSICFYDLHLSAAGCPCSPDKYSCLQHAKQLCMCAWSDRYFLFRYKIIELNVLVEALQENSSALDKWAKEILGLRAHSSVSKNGLPAPAMNGTTSTIAEEPKLSAEVYSSTKEIPISKLKETENRVSETLGPTVTSNGSHVIQKISTSTVLTKSSPQMSSLETERPVLDSGISLKSKIHLLLASCSNSQPNSKEDVTTLSKRPPNTCTDLTIFKHPKASLAETPVSNLSPDNQVTEKSSTSCSHNVIILSDDDD